MDAKEKFLALAWSSNSRRVATSSVLGVAAMIGSVALIGNNKTPKAIPVAAPQPAATTNEIEDLQKFVFRHDGIEACGPKLVSVNGREFSYYVATYKDDKGEATVLNYHHLEHGPTSDIKDLKEFNKPTIASLANSMASDLCKQEEAIFTQAAKPLVRRHKDSIALRHAVSRRAPKAHKKPTAHQKRIHNYIPK